VGYAPTYQCPMTFQVFLPLFAAPAVWWNITIVRSDLTPKMARATFNSLDYADQFNLEHSIHPPPVILTTAFSLRISVALPLTGGGISFNVLDAYGVFGMRWRFS